MPVICGNNAGQHIYLNAGFADSTDLSATISVSKLFNKNMAPLILFLQLGTDSSIERRWKIKVTQHGCGSVSNPPAGCQMYNQELAGQFRSYNFAESNQGNVRY